MLPMNMRVFIKDRKGKRVNLWLPLFLLWPVLMVLVAPGVLLLFLIRLWRFCQGRQMPKVFSLLLGAFDFLSALRGLTVDVEDGENKVKIKIN